MHRSAAAALTLLLSSVLLCGVAEAQGTARNTVTVHIPAVLRLTLDQGTARAKQSLGVKVDGMKVDPASVIVRVFANTDWTLSVSDDSSGAPTLDVCTDPVAMERCKPIAPEVTIAAGGVTGGWTDHPLGFRVDPSSAPAASETVHTLTFTLSRP